MAICPHCRNYLGRTDLESGQCSYCNGMLESAEEQYTVGSRQRTEGIVQPAGRGQKAEDGSPSLPTAALLASRKDSLPPTDSASLRSTADDHNIAGTIYVPSGEAPSCLLPGADPQSGGEIVRGQGGEAMDPSPSLTTETSPPRSLNPSTPNSATAAAPRFDATIDLGSLLQVATHEEAPDPGRKTAEDHRSAATLYIPGSEFSADPPATPNAFATPDPQDEPDKSRKTRDQRRFDATVDLSALPDDVAQKWDGQYDKGASPRASIGGRAHGLAEEPDLIIHPRAICDAKSASVAEADYEILRLLGKGGMGEVLAARQASINRSVALKKINAQHAKNPESRRKFLAEAVVTGDLEHPNIVPIYDLGKDDAGLLFYVMKHVHGTPWDRVIAKKPFVENLEIFMKVADAVAFAHSRGVVHRDLKPENVMLGGFGEVLVMDWGLAIKVGTQAAKTAGVGGTPAYMAPEMMASRPEQIGFASDVYLLGAILYEVIAGIPPHGGATVQECLISVFKNTIQPTDRDDELVSIALKAMATKPEDRYASVGDLQEAIRQYQSHWQSVILAKRAEDDLAAAAGREDYDLYARALFAFQEAHELWEGNDAAKEGIARTSLAYSKRALSKENYDLAGSLLDEGLPEHRELLVKIRAAQKEQRARQQRLKAAKRIGFALAATIFFIVTAALIVIRREYKRAEVAKEAALREKGMADEAKEVAVKAKDQAEIERQKAVSAENVAKNAKSVAENAEAQAKRDKETAVLAEAQAKKDKEAAVVAESQAKTEKKAAEDAKEKEEYGAYVARIGLASAKIDENAFDMASSLLNDCPPRLRNWEWGRLERLCKQSDKTIVAPERIEALALSPDGTRFVTAGLSNTARLWDAKTGRQITELHTGGERIFAAAYSPDGRFIALGTNDKPNYLQVFSAQTGKLAWQVTSRRPVGGAAQGHDDAVLSVVFSRDGGKLLTSSYDNTARLFDCTTHEEIRAFRGHDWWVWSARFSPDERWIVTASQDGTAIVWDAASGEARATFRGHTGPVYTAVVVPEGIGSNDSLPTAYSLPPANSLPHFLVASGGYDKRIILWRPDALKDFDYASLAKSDDIRQAMASTTADTTGQRALLAGHTAAVWSLAISADGRLLSSASFDNTVRVWKLDTRQLVKTLRGHSGRVHAVAFAPPVQGGTPVLYSAGLDQKVKIWDMQRYEEMRVIDVATADGHHDAVLGADFAPDGQHVVTASRDRTARIWDLSGRTVGVLQEGHDYLASVAVFFPSGKRMLTAAVDSTARVWDVGSGGQVFVLKKTGAAAAATISHDGRWILTGGDGEEEGSRQRAVGSNASPPTAYRLPPANSADFAWPAKLWDASSGSLVHILGGHKSEVTAVAFSADDQIIFTGDAAGHGQLYGFDRATARFVPPGDSQKIHARTITASAFTSGGLLTASGDNTMALWDVERNPKGFALRLRRIFEHPDAVTGLAVSSDGALLATTCADRTVRFWNLQSPAPTAQILTGPDRVPHFYAAAAADEIRKQREAELAAIRQQRRDLLLESAKASSRSMDAGEAIAAVDRKLQALANREREAAGGEEVRSVALSPITGVAATTSSNGVVRLWDVANSRELGSGNSRQQAAGSRQKADLDSPALPSANSLPATNSEPAFRSSSGLAWSTAFAPSGTYLATVGGNDARLWDSGTGHEAMRFGPQGAVASAHYSPDGLHIVTASWDNAARIWDAESGRVQQKLVGHTDYVNSAVYSSDGRYILTASDDATAALWLAASGLRQQVFEGGGQRVRAADLSCDADGAVRNVVAAGDDGVARLFDAAGHLERELRGHDKAVLAVAYSRQGDRILTASEDNRAIVWNAQTGEKLLVLEGHTAGVTTVAFSPDGLRALTGSRDNTVKVWELKTGKELLTLKGHTQEVTAARFSVDNSSIVTASLDGTWVLWLSTPWK